MYVLSLPYDTPPQSLFHRKKDCTDQGSVEKENKKEQKGAKGDPDIQWQGSRHQVANRVNGLCTIEDQVVAVCSRV